MGFKVVNKSFQARKGSPVVRIDKHRVLHINNFAMQTYFDKAEAVLILWDEEKKMIGIKAADKSDRNCYKITRANGSGHVACRGAIRKIFGDNHKVGKFLGVWKNDVLEVMTNEDIDNRKI